MSSSLNVSPIDPSRYDVNRRPVERTQERLDVRDHAHRMAAYAGANQRIVEGIAQEMTARASVYAQVATELGTLNDTTSSMLDANSFAPSSLSNSDPTRISANLGVTARGGNYVITVNTRAQAQINSSDAFANANSSPFVNKGGLVGQLLPTSGSVSIKVGAAAAKSFAVTSTTTINSFVGSINAARMAADGTRVTLTTDKTGSAQALTIVEKNTALNFNKYLVQPAQDATGNINGVAFSQPTNTDSTSLPGVTLGYLGTTTASGAVTLSITKGAGPVADAVHAFVTSYNAAIAQLDVATRSTTADASATMARPIFSRTATGAIDALTKSVTSVPASAYGTYHTFAEIGVTLNADHSLSIDGDKLAHAVTTDASSVASLLAPSGSMVGGIADKVHAIASSLGGPSGTFATLQAAELKRADDQQETLEDMRYQMDAEQETLQDNYEHYQRTMADLEVQSAEMQAYGNTVYGPAHPDQRYDLIDRDSIFGQRRSEPKKREVPPEATESDAPAPFGPADADEPLDVSPPSS
jgi:flagellar hook-associated protein 2